MLRGYQAISLRDIRVSTNKKGGTYDIAAYEDSQTCQRVKQKF